MAPPVTTTDTTTDTQGRIDEFAKDVAAALDQGEVVASELIPLLLERISEETGCTPQRGGTVEDRREAVRIQRDLAKQYKLVVGIAEWENGWVITPFSC